MYKTNAQLNAWWQRRLGSYVLETEAAMMREILPCLRGEHLVLLGCSEQMRLVIASEIRYKNVLNRTVSALGAHSAIQGSWDDLPLADNSLQTLIIPHTLEILFDESRAVFNEIYRVLKPEGDLIVFGFNPSIVWRLWRRCYSKDGFIPWMNKCKTRSDLRFSLSLLDYRIVLQKTGVHSLPVDGRKRTLLINKVLGLIKKICPWFGGVYLLHAKKQTIGVIPLNLSWKEKYRELEAVERIAPVPRTKVECKNCEEN